MNAPAAANDILDLAELLRPALLRASRQLRREGKSVV